MGMKIVLKLRLLQKKNFQRIFEVKPFAVDEKLLLLLSVKIRLICLVEMYLGL